jgi:hypothetical protein
VTFPPRNERTRDYTDARGAVQAAVTHRYYRELRGWSGPSGRRLHAPNRGFTKVTFTLHYAPH